MAISLDFDSYDGLQGVVAAYLQRANLTAQIPVFIRLAEVRLGNSIKTLPQQVALPYSLIPAQGTNVIPLPSDYGAMLRATYNNVPLVYIPPEAVNLEKTKHNYDEFTIIGNKFFLQTQVDGSSTLTIYYYQALQGLSEYNESNWLLEDYPNIYLYAVLLEAVTYIKDDEEIAVWQQMLGQAITEVGNASRVANIPQQTRLTRTRT
ncbi:phage adaptor protein [Paraburkholderia graminis]